MLAHVRDAALRRIPSLTLGADEPQRSVPFARDALPQREGAVADPCRRAEDPVVSGTRDDRGEHASSGIQRQRGELSRIARAE